MEYRASILGLHYLRGVFQVGAGAFAYHLGDNFIGAPVNECSLSGDTVELANVNS